MSIFTGLKYAPSYKYTYMLTKQHLAASYVFKKITRSFIFELPIAFERSAQLALGYTMEIKKNNTIMLESKAGSLRQLSTENVVER